MLLEMIDQTYEIAQGPCQPVDLVDDHRIDLSHLDITHQPRKGRPFEVCTGPATIIIVHRQLDPALISLTEYIRAADLPLSD